MIKKYIFFTSDIRTMGGAQNYVRSKINYLKAQGWKVYIFFTDSHAEGCAFEEMREYTDGAIEKLLTYAGDVYGTFFYYEIISKMFSHIEYDCNQECRYVVESHEERVAVWAEILAKKISAKHIFFCLQENFDVIESTQREAYIDFLKFKFSRREIAGIANDSLHRMFKGYMDADVSDEFKLVAKVEDNVKDIYVEAIEKIERKDWNIAYMGRCEKQYFQFMLYELRIFCKKYKEKDIQFIIIGKLKDKERKMVDELQSIDNLTVSCLGFFNPLPQKLFAKMDVMIAGAGCATISDRQGVPVIVPNVTTNTAVGILGYTTTSVFSGDEEYSYCELLEDILINKNYLSSPHVTISRPSCEEAYERFFEFINESVQSEEYYQFDFAIKEENNRRNVIEKLKAFLCAMRDNHEKREKFVNWLAKEYGGEVSLFGFGKMGRLLTECIPELKITHIFDNQAEDVCVERPIEQALQNVQTIIVTPYGFEREIREELCGKKYGGVAVSLKDIVLKYMQQTIE